MENDELPSLDRLEEKINRHKKETQPPQDVTNTGAGIAARFASELASGVLVGTVMGYYLDKWLGTSPFLLLLFLGLGTVAGFMTMIRSARHIQSREEGSDQKE